MRRTLVMALLFLCTSSPAAAQSPTDLIGDSFVALRVADLESASTWYADVFELREVNRIERGELSIILLTGDHLSVELIRQDGVERPEGRHLGLFKSGFFVRDIESFLAEMHRRGIDADEEIFVDEALQMRSFLMRDVEGNRLQVFERCSDRCRIKEPS